MHLPGSFKSCIPRQHKIEQKENSFRCYEIRVPRHSGVPCQRSYLIAKWGQHYPPQSLKNKIFVKVRGKQKFNVQMKSGIRNAGETDEKHHSRPRTQICLLLSPPSVSFPNIERANTSPTQDFTSSSTADYRS